MGNTEQGAGTRSRGGRRARVMAVLALAVLVPSVADAQFFWSRSRLDEDDAARAAIAQGFQLLSRPVRDDNVFVAEVVNRRGSRERLIIADDTGRILQRIPLESRRAFRRFGDPSIPPGPIPPGRIPDGDRGEPSMLSRLFGGDDRSPADLSAPEPRDRMAHPPRQRRAARTSTDAPAVDTLHDTPVESAPLAPPAAAPTLPPRVAKPVPQKPAPAQASLPPAAAPPEPAPAAPVAPAPAPAPAAAAPDRPVRSITTNPLAIPGSREQDEKAASARPAAPAGRAAAPSAKAPAAPLPLKDPVAVAPLD